MDWSNERYVRLYTRIEPDEMFWPFEARALFPQLLRRASRAGIINLGRHDPAKAVAKLVDFPLEFTRAGLAGLLDDGCIVLRGGFLVFRNYIEAQEAHQSEAHRKRESRAKHRDRLLLLELSGNGTPASGNEPPPDETGHDGAELDTSHTRPESGHTHPVSGHDRPESGRNRPLASKGVQTGHSVPSRAEPSRTDPKGGGSADAQGKSDSDVGDGTPPPPERTGAPGDTDRPDRTGERPSPVLISTTGSTSAPTAQELWDEDEDPDARPAIEGCWQLWDIWEEVACGGRGAGGVKRPFRADLRVTYAACEKRAPRDPSGLWRRVVEAFVETQRTRGADLRLDWLLRDFAVFADRVARATATPSPLRTREPTLDELARKSGVK